MNENNHAGGFPNGGANANMPNGDNVVSRQQAFYRAPQTNVGSQMVQPAQQPVQKPVQQPVQQPVQPKSAQPVIRRGGQQNTIDRLANNSNIADDALSNIGAEKAPVIPRTSAPVKEEAPEIEADEQEYDSEQEIKERRSHKRRRKAESRASGCLKSVLYAVIVLTVSLVVGFYILSIAFDFIGVARPSDESTVQFVVSQGDTIEDIALNLKKEDIITQPTVFQMFIKYVKKDVTFTPGVYTVKTNADYNSLIHQLQYTASSSDTVRLTFPEGYTIDDIAELLEDEGVCTRSDLIECIKTGDFSGYDFINDLDNLESRYYRLEGYMYPDTYDFFQNESPKSVINKFLNNFQNKMTDALKGRAEEINMSVDDVITMASLIQKEAPDFDNMCGVSAVFHNRLKSGGIGYLQTDTTSDYPSSKYDTYKNPGLPPGAICSPGIEAIEAALYPEEGSKAIFFVSDKNGKFYFAETNAGHEKNIQEMKRVNNEN